MKKFKKSDLVIPISLIINLGLINGILYLLTPYTYSHWVPIVYYNLAWIFITFGLSYYATERRESFGTNIKKMFQLYLIFALAYFALFGFTEIYHGSFRYQLGVLFLVFSSLTLYRMFFFLLRNYLRKLGRNSVRVVVIGRDANLKKIRKVFDNPSYGYRYKGYFDNTISPSPTFLGKVEESFLYILENNIDEIYCVASKFSKDQLKNLIHFADNNLIKFNIILDNKEIFSRAMSIEPYENVPVLNLRKIPLDTDYAQHTKRIFDIVVSLFVIVTILSWLTPLLFILIKLESRGPLFFKQKRHGLKRKVFQCYKFRSMTVNSDSDSKMAVKNDVRVTKIGSFIRKTSIDELPQFINVFLGNMSVVGPRPHMELHTWDYEVLVDKYLVRHFIKPGITGLAQIRGYRGEITKPSDISNRVRLDIFYVESWSFSLDLWIVYQTVITVFKRDGNAY